MISKIIAIGGGEISTGETIKIDEYIVKSSRKNKPKLLFIPTASSDSKGYIDSVFSVFQTLGCTVDSLCLIAEEYTKDQIEEKIMSADIIYVGGGNTKFMMSVWNRHDIGYFINKAYIKGVILAGLSAGAICWFKKGYSDNAKSKNSNKELIFVDGLSLIPFILCPHYEDSVRETFDGMINDKKEVGIALDSYTALVYRKNSYEIIRCNTNKNAFIFNKGSKKKLNSIDL